MKAGGKLSAVAAAALAALLLGASPPAAAEDGDAALRAARERGWGYLVEKLSHDGVDRHRAARAFADPRAGTFSGLYFSLHPREPRSLYRGFLTSASVARARRCRAQHEVAFVAAEEQYGVSASVLAAILHVETACGQNTGHAPILAGLARLAMAAEPNNLRENVQRLTGGASLESEDAQPVIARAQRLEDTFYPEVRATFELAERMHMDPLDIRGSGSGAFGIPQFLPTSYLRYGRDGDGDGAVSLYDHDDAIASCASYLSGHGWRQDLSLSEKRRVVWEYNHSPAYIDTVLSLANRIDSPLQYAEATSGHAKRGATKTAKSTTKKKSPALASASAKKAHPQQQAKRGSTAPSAAPRAEKGKLTRPAPMTNG